MPASQRATRTASNQHASPAPRPVNTELDPKAVPDWVFLSIKTTKSSSQKKRSLPTGVADESSNHDDEGYGSTSGDGSDSVSPPHLHSESASKKQRKPNHVRKRVRLELLNLGCVAYIRNVQRTWVGVLLLGGAREVGGGDPPPGGACGAAASGDWHRGSPGDRGEIGPQCGPASGADPPGPRVRQLPVGVHGLHCTCPFCHSVICIEW